MSEHDIRDDMIAVLETALRELVVELTENGSLSRREVSKALLRTEYIAETFDTDPECPEAKSAEYARIFQSWYETRLGTKPDLYALRKEREKWIEEGQQGPDPWEVARIEE